MTNHDAGLGFAMITVGRGVELKINDPQQMLEPSDGLCYPSISPGRRPGLKPAERIIPTSCDLRGRQTHFPLDAPGPDHRGAGHT